MKPLRGALPAAAAALALAALLAGAGGSALGVCGPFTDVSDATFCPFVLEIFTLGITTGTSATTYSPNESVSRLQMAAFLSRGVDGALKRGSRRAALRHFWTAQSDATLGLTTVGANPHLLQSDGLDIWVAEGNGTVSRVRAPSGNLLGTWTGAEGPEGILVATGRVLITSSSNNPGKLFAIDPSEPPSAVATVSSQLGAGPEGITFDGGRVWTSNGPGHSVSIVTPGPSYPWTVTTVTTGFQGPFGALYDGSNVWVTDVLGNTLLRLDPAGVILQTVTVGDFPAHPAFDGTNLWVPNTHGASVTVVRAATGAVLATLTGNGLGQPFDAAFDGERVMVTSGTSDMVSLWKAADLTPLGFVFTGKGSRPTGVCSDGVSFWITLNTFGQIARL